MRESIFLSRPTLERLIAWSATIASALLVTSLREDSLQALAPGFSIAFPVSTMALVLLRPKIPRRLMAFVVCYGLFLLWSWLSLMRSEAGEGALQNLIAYSVFFFGVIWSAQAGPSAWQAINSSIRSLLPIILVVFSAGSVLSEETSELFLERPFALLLVVFLVWTFPVARFSDRLVSRWTSYAVSLGAVAAIAATGSRTALGIALLLLALSLCIDRSGRVHLGAVVVAVSVLAVGLVVILPLFPSFHERPGGDVVEVQGLELNVSGRGSMWERVYVSWTSSRSSLLFGQGPGSSVRALESLKEDAHPHNEYLRIAHDFGAVGVSLWLLGVLSVTLGPARSSLRRVRSKSGFEPVQVLIGFNAAVMLAISCAVLNPLVYVFIMAPLSLMVGSVFNERALLERCPPRDQRDTSRVPVHSAE